MYIISTLYENLFSIIIFKLCVLDLNQPNKMTILRMYQYITMFKPPPPPLERSAGGILVIRSSIRLSVCHIKSLGADTVTKLQDFCNILTLHPGASIFHKHMFS